MGPFMGEKRLINNEKMIQTRTNSAKKKTQINKKCFIYKYIVGKGGFGKVWKVEHNKNKRNFAMK